MLFLPKGNQELAEMHLPLTCSFPQASPRVLWRTAGYHGAEIFPPAQSVKHWMEAGGVLFCSQFSQGMSKEGPSCTPGGLSLLTAALLRVKIKVVKSKVLLTVTVLSVRT